VLKHKWAVTEMGLRPKNLRPGRRAKAAQLTAARTPPASQPSARSDGGQRVMAGRARIKAAQGVGSETLAHFHSLPLTDGVQAAAWCAPAGAVPVEAAAASEPSRPATCPAHRRRDAAAPAGG
jgi:hypothetical protein